MNGEIGGRARTNCTCGCCVCESAHWLSSGKIQVVLVRRIDLMEIVKDFANWMIKIFLGRLSF